MKQALELLAQKFSEYVFILYGLVFMSYIDYDFTTLWRALMIRDIAWIYMFIGLNHLHFDYCLIKASIF